MKTLYIIAGCNGGGKDAECKINNVELFEKIKEYVR